MLGPVCTIRCHFVNVISNESDIKERIDDLPRRVGEVNRIIVAIAEKIVIACVEQFWILAHEPAKAGMIRARSERAFQVPTHGIVGMLTAHALTGTYR